MMPMTRYDMTCDTFAGQLTDYLEGDASGLVRAGVDAHAAGCGACGALLADLVALPLDARALPALVPSRDLWSGIAERIDARVLPLEGGGGRRAMLAARHRWSRPAIAAAALMLFTAGITSWLTRASLSRTPAFSTTASSGAVPAAGQVANVAPVVDDGPERVDGATPHASPDATGGGSRVAARGGRADGERPAAAPALRAARRLPVGEMRDPVPARLASSNSVPSPDPVYDGDISALRKIVSERRAQLDPATLAVLEQSVAVIDSAIAQSRAALARDPASRFLATQLDHSLGKKVELLRTAAMLPART